MVQGWVKACIEQNQILGPSEWGGFFAWSLVGASVRAGLEGQRVEHTGKGGSPKHDPLELLKSRSKRLREVDIDALVEDLKSRKRRSGASLPPVEVP